MGLTEPKQSCNRYIYLLALIIIYLLAVIFIFIYFILFHYCVLRTIKTKQNTVTNKEELAVSLSKSSFFLFFFFVEIQILIYASFYSSAIPGCEFFVK
jgi:hypothetical protein